MSLHAPDGWIPLISTSGVRAAIHRALKIRGYDPVARDPWYFPSMEDYVKVIEFLF